MVKRHHNSHQRKHGKARSRSWGNNDTIRTSRLLTKRRKVRVTKTDQQEILPLQGKLEKLTKISIPKNEKEQKSFLGAIQKLSKHTYQKLASKYRHSEKTVEGTERMGIDRRKYQSVQRTKRRCCQNALTSALNAE